MTCMKVCILYVVGVRVNILRVWSLTVSMWTSVRLPKLSHVCLGASVCVCACRDIAILVCQALLWAVMTSLLVTCRNERRTADITSLSPFLTLFLLPYIYISRHADNTSDLFVLSHRLTEKENEREKKGTFFLFVPHALHSAL